MNRLKRLSELFAKIFDCKVRDSHVRVVNIMPTQCPRGQRLCCHRAGVVDSYTRKYNFRTGLKILFYSCSFFLLQSKIIYQLSKKAGSNI